MNFDYTYIILFGFRIFEPMVIVTNALFFTLCALYFKRLNKSAHPYAIQMGWFMLMLGTSSVFGAIGHAVHMQLGEIFFKTVLFIMNAFSLLSIYFCFRAAYTYINLNKTPSKKYVYLVMAWVLMLLIACGIQENFALIKIHAGIVLVYSLIVHYLVYKRTQDVGNKMVVTGILISFLSITVHSLKLSIHEWFNHKDLAHVIMIVSLIVIYRGASRIVQKLPAKSAEILNKINL